MPDTFGEKKQYYMIDSKNCLILLYPTQKNKLRSIQLCELIRKKTGIKGWGMEPHKIINNFDCSILDKQGNSMNFT